MRAQYLALGSQIFEMDICYDHIQGVDNRVADLLSTWSGLFCDWDLLHSYICEPVWLEANENMLALDPEL